MLTETPLLDIFRRQSQNGEYFDHYLNSHICHRSVAWDLRINTEASEEIADAFEKIDEGIIARTDTASCLI